MHQHLFFSRIQKIGLSLIFSFFIASGAYAAGWASLLSSVSSSLYAIDFSGTTGYAVGADGSLVYTSDRGKTWKEGSLSTSKDFFDVAAVSSTVAYASGESGVIAKTEDGGKTWKFLDSSTSVSLYEIVMTSTSTGYTVGASGVILKTTDSGKTWKEQTSGISVALYGLSFVSNSSSTLWAVGENGVILKTTDSGSTWKQETSATSVDLTAIDMVSSSAGWIGGENGMVLKTTDGGSHWSLVSVSQIDGYDVKDVAFLSSTGDGFISAEGDRVYKTTDGGANWSHISFPGSSDVLSITYEDEEKIWASGSDGALFGYDVGNPGKPTNFTIRSGSPTHDSTPTFDWSAATDGESSVDHYEFRMDAGSYTDIGSFTSYTVSHVLTSGDHTAYLRAVDDAGNTGSVVSLSFMITETDVPEVGKISPTSAVEDVTVTLSATVSDDHGVDECLLYVNGVKKKTMSVKGEQASVSYTFTDTDSYSVAAQCSDDEGNSTTGSSVTITVSKAITDVESGDLVKTACSDTVYVNDPCTAVYFYGPDGKRHAFPNERVFKTWYKNYDNMVIVTAKVMASIPLGKNVTYRPGVRLIKFDSSNAVYAITRGGVLRPIANGAIAAGIYGSDWVSDIESVSDVFFGNYEMGELIDSTLDYNPTTEKNAVTSISKDL